jgi:peptidoglycan/LPS O-acetylase OafA/YrhL
VRSLLSGATIKEHPLAVEKLDQLTSLRFIAALMVVFVHLPGNFGVTAAPLNLAQGVSFFFVLSGFVLTYVYPDLRGWAEIRKFWRARGARIWPAYMAAFVVGAWLTHYTWDLWTLVAHLLMLQAWMPLSAYYFSYNAVAWSVSVELFFYLAFPFLALVLRKSWKLLALGGFSGLVLWLTWVSSTNFPAYGAPGTPEGKIVTLNGLLYISPLSRVFEFIVGMLTAHLWRHHRLTMSYGIATLAEIAAITLCIVSMYSTNLLEHVLAQSGAIALGNWVGVGGSCLAFAITLYVFACGQGAVSSLLRIRPLVFLGEVSFSIYLLHEIALRYFANPTVEIFWLDHQWALLGYLVVIGVGAALVWYLIEIPGKHLIRHGLASGSRAVLAQLKSSPRGAFATTVAGCFLLIFLMQEKGWLDENGSFGSVATAPVHQSLIGANFADSIELQGVSVNCRGNDMIVRLRWLKKSEVAPDLAQAIHVIDDEGKILSQGDYPLSASLSGLETEETWQNRLVLPRSKIQPEAKSLAIGMYDANGLYPIDHAQTDWDGHRLIVPFDRCGA